MKKLIFDKFKANIIKREMTISIVGGKQTCGFGGDSSTVDCTGGSCFINSDKCVECSTTHDQVCNI